MVKQAEQTATWWVYLLACADGTIYTGMTIDVERRLRQHNAGRGARYTRTRRPVTLAGSVACSCRADAMRLETRLKRLSHPAKVRYAAQQTVPEA